MKKDDIIRMAREAGSVIELVQEKDLRWLERFAALVAAAEREACAKVCDVLAVHPLYSSEATKLAALAIRERSKI